MGQMKMPNLTIKKRGFYPIMLDTGLQFNEFHGSVGKLDDRLEIEYSKVNYNDRR
jgi:hypothetical protein